jgi:hypothetical protein
VSSKFMNGFRKTAAPSLLKAVAKKGMDMVGGKIGGGLSLLNGVSEGASGYSKLVNAAARPNA